MSRKLLIWIGMTVGSIIGTYIPVLFGADGAFSITSLVFSTLGGIAGIWAGFKLSEYVS